MGWSSTWHKWKIDHPQRKINISFWVAADTGFLQFTLLTNFLNVWKLYEEFALEPTGLCVIGSLELLIYGRLIVNLPYQCLRRRNDHQFLGMDCYGLKHVVKMKLSHMQFCCQWHSVKEFYFFCLQMKFVWIATYLVTPIRVLIAVDGSHLTHLSWIHYFTKLIGWVSFIVKGVASRRPGHQFGCWLEDGYHFQENDMKQIWFKPRFFFDGAKSGIQTETIQI